MKSDLRLASIGSTMKHRALVRMSMPGARMRHARPMRRVVDLVMRRPVTRSNSRIHFALCPQQFFNIDNALHMHWYLRVEHSSVQSTSSSMQPWREATRQPASSYAQHVRSMLPSRAAPSRTWLGNSDTRHSQRPAARGERSVEVALSGTVANVSAQFASPAAWPLATLADRAIRAIRAKAAPPRFDSRLASHRSDQASIEANDIPRVANVAASRYAPISLQVRPEPHRTSTRREPVAPSLNPWHAPRIDLVWRKPAVQELAEARPSSQQIEARPAGPSKADLRTFTSPSMSAPRIDAANTERLADEVLRRVERQLRIERERRGL